MRRAIQIVFAAVLAATATATSAESVMKQCGDQWKIARAAGTTNGETWPQFLSQCRAQLKSGTAPPSTAAPAPAPSVPTPPPTQATAPAPAPSPYASTPAPTGAVEFMSGQQAHARCPADTVVWVNSLSHVYHYNVVSSHGRRYYGNTAEGAYMCDADARAAGDRPAKDERHP